MSEEVSGRLKKMNTVTDCSRLLRASACGGSSCLRCAVCYRFYRRDDVFMSDDVSVMSAASGMSDWL